MTAAAKQPQARPQPDDVARQVEVLTTDNAVLEDRVAKLETAVGKILGVNPSLPVIGAAFSTIKAVAADLDYSESYIRKLIKRGKLDAVKRGGRILIRADSVALVRSNVLASTSRRA